MTRSLLPIGIQDFRTIRSEGFRYVDKTPLVRRLVDEGRHYFLSRPRRFGKSLLLDTLKCLFEGHESLFRGLDIHPHWDWSSPHPVVRLGFGGRYSEPGDVERNVLAQLALLERDAGLPPASCGTGPERLLDLLDRLHGTTGRQAAVCWWTSTTGRSWTRSTTRSPRGPTGTTCAGSTASSRAAPGMSALSLSPA